MLSVLAKFLVAFQLLSQKVHFTPSIGVLAGQNRLVVEALQSIVATCGFQLVTATSRALFHLWIAPIANAMTRGAEVNGWVHEFVAALALQLLYEGLLGKGHDLVNSSNTLH